MSRSIASVGGQAATTVIAAPLPAVVVTGASSGIGCEFARVAGREGNPVLLVARAREALRQVSEELQALGSETAWLSVDLRDPDAAGQIEAALAAHGWYCSVLVHAAGLGVLGRAHEADPDRQLAVVDVNVRALTALTLRFLPVMVARRAGGIIIVGSAAGYISGPNMAIYYATKAYTRSLSNALYAETKGCGVTVTCVAPGYVRTPFLFHSGISETRLRKMLPLLSATEVADAGWKAFKFRRRSVVPGMLTRFLVCAAAVMPTWFLLWLVGTLQRERGRPSLS